MNMPPEKVAVLVITGVIAILVSVTLLNSPERVDRDRERVWDDPVESADAEDFDEIVDPEELRRGERRTRVIAPKPEPKPSAGGEGGQGTGVPRPAPAKRHVIQRNETLGGIARRYYGRESAWQIIKRANPGLNERALRPGSRIVIPSLAGRRPVDQRPQRRAVRSPSGGATPGVGDGSGRWHVVKNGESLRRIARREYGRESDWRKIFEANRNRLRRPELIRAGQRLFIPVAAR